MTDINIINLPFFLNIFILILYFTFHISIFRNFQNDSMKYFSFIFQLVVCLYILINNQNYTPIISFVYDEFLLVVLLLFSSIELKPSLR